MKKRMLALLLSASMMFSMAACGSENESSKDSESSAASSSLAASSSASDSDVVWDAYTPYKETVYFTKGVSKTTNNENYANGDSLLNNHNTRYVKEQVNVEAKIAWETDINNYPQKVALSIASKDIPDVLVIDKKDRKLFKQLVENDLVEDLTEAYNKCASPFVKDNYDSFDKYGDDLFKEVMVNAKMMGLPGTQIAGQHSILWIRQDWLDKLGLQVPETLDEINTVAKTFIEKDPGGTGNPVGLPIHEEVVGVYNEIWGIYTIFSLFNSYPGQWIEKDGKAVYGSTLDTMKPAMEKLAQMYKEGIIDKEFAIKKGEDRQALISSGRSGMLFGPWWSQAGIPESVKNNPNAEWTAVTAPTDADGNLHIYSRDPLNSIMVVRKGYEHPEAIMKVINTQMDIIRGHGESGAAAREVRMKEAPALANTTMPINVQIDYVDAMERNINDITQALEKNDIKALKYPNNQAMYKSFVMDRDNYKGDIGVWHNVLVRKFGMRAAMAKNTVVQPVTFYSTTETMTTKWANLKKLETEMIIKIIMGEKPISEFDNFVEQWYKMGGTEITAEVEAERTK